MKQDDDTQTIRYANLPNCPTDRLKKRREQPAKKRDEKLAIAQRHPAATSWRTRARREVEGCKEKIASIDKVISNRGE
jgi:hypothetical protein